MPRLITYSICSAIAFAQNTIVDLGQVRLQNGYWQLLKIWAVYFRISKVNLSVPRRCGRSVSENPRMDRVCGPRNRCRLLAGNVLSADQFSGCFCHVVCFSCHISRFLFWISKLPVCEPDLACFLSEHHCWC